MKQLWMCAIAAFALGVAMAPDASAQNSLAVTSAAAMGNSTAQNACEGDGMPGPCGLEMRYEPGQTNRAKVVHNNFGVESIFRERFFMDVNNFDAAFNRRNFFHVVSGCFPRNEAGCRLLPTYRADVVRTFVGYKVGAGAYDNQRNRVGLTRCPVPSSGPFEVEIQWTAGCNPTRGDFTLTIFEDGVATCTRTAKVQNCHLNVTAFNFETLKETDVQGSSTLYIDEFSSFRTLAP